MSKDLVKKSLYKFLDDNLDYYVTYDSNNSKLENITDLSVNTDITYIAPTPITEVVCYYEENLFTTSDNIIGCYLCIYDETGEILLGKDLIVAIDAITKAIEVQNGFTFDILTSYKITILQDKLIYFRSPYGVINNDTRLHSLGQRDRYDLILKAKDDSNKVKIDTIIQDVRDLIFEGDCNFEIYNDLAVKIGYARILERSYSENEIMDISNDMQSFLVSFVVEYFIKYK